MNQINEEYIEDYIRSLVPKAEGILKELEEYGENNHIPIIEPEVAQFLRVILKINNPKKILEIGTAIGYSAIVMAESTDINTTITSLEIREDMVKLAEENISRLGYENRIKILQGDAEELLPTLRDKYDFIFLDAAKGQYMKFFEECMRLLNPGGVIVSDNVLYKGMVATDKLVLRRKKTIVKRLRKFLKYINDIEGYTSCVIPLGDGIALTYKEE